MKKFLLNLTIHHWALMMLVAFLSTGITANAQEEKKDNKEKMDFMKYPKWVKGKYDKKIIEMVC